MSSEMEKILRSVMKEELAPIQTDINGLKSDMTSVKDDITGLKSDMTSVKDDITGLKSDMTSVKDDITGLKSDTTDLKEGQAQLRKDIIQHLGKFTEQIAQHVDDQTAVLNKRVFIILGEKTPSSAKQGGD